MKFLPTDITGAFLIEPEQREDDRGFFARTYCVDELTQQGLDPRVVQRSISYNRRRGTLRGMHFQVSPHEENKIVSCIRGEIYDVVLDLRRASPSYLRWYAATLTADNHRLLYVPKGCAHGFITLTDDAIVHYEISEFHHPESAHGVRYDDPAFAIAWPLPPAVVSPRDLAYEAFRD